MTHTLVADNKKKKGKFEKMFLDGRPPVALGVTSGGDFFGGTQISFTDVLGDQQFNMFAASVSQYRTMSFSYLNLERRFQWAVQGYSQTQFFYGQLEGVFYDPAFSGFIDRDLAVATRTIRGGTAFGIYPFNRYRRVEVYGGCQPYQRAVRRSGRRAGIATSTSRSSSARTLFNNGTMVPLGVAFVQETTVFREFGPLAGSTMRLSTTRSRRRSATRCRARRSTSMRASTSASAAAACSRCARAASRAGATTPTSSTSAATPRCAATTTCRSSGRTRSS